MSVCEMFLHRKNHQANRNDIRGETWQWDQARAVQIIVCRRKTGSISCHFHLGEDPSKNPEKLFIASGRVLMTFLNQRTGETHQLFLESGESLSIFPNIVHKTEILEGAVILESRVTIFNPSMPDTYPAEIR